MNEIKMTGTLQKAPYVAAKGWVGVTLLVPKADSTYKAWVPLYVPVGLAANAFKNAEANETFTITGEWDEAKDKDGNRKAQVKVFRAQRMKSKPADESLGIEDSDIPW